MFRISWRPRLSAGASRASLAFLACLLTTAADGRADEHTLGFDGKQAGNSGIPQPWQALGNPNARQPDFRVVKDQNGTCLLRLHAKGDESDGIHRPVKIDLRKTPYVNFSWFVKVHPNGRIETDKDDQAIQVQLDFGRRGLRRRVLSYGFDPAAPAGQFYDDSSFFAENRVLVLDTGREKLGQWVSHSRNIARDYRRCYRSRPPRLHSISLFCDSNDSHSEALSYCTGITFSDKPLFSDDDAEESEDEE